MNDITVLMQRLKEAASKATQGEWQVYEKPVSTNFDAMYIFSRLIQGTAGEQDVLYMLSVDGLCPALTGTGPNSKNNAEFIAQANPANILALVEVLEELRAQIDRQEDFIREQDHLIGNLKNNWQVSMQRVYELEESHAQVIHARDHYKALWRESIADAEPVVVSDDMAYAFHHAMSDSSLSADEVEEIKTGLRAAFANAAAPQLAAMNSKPVAWDYEWASCITCEGPQNFKRVIEREAPPAWAIDEGQARNIIPLYHHALPAQERDHVRREHAEWSLATFGNVGPIGPLKHLSKEALEAAAEPGDLSEWADMQFLLWDAQRRAGITDEQITQAMIEKLAVNKQREWPEPKDGEPRLHIKAQPAPVVPEEIPKGLAGQIVSLFGAAFVIGLAAILIWG